MLHDRHRDDKALLVGTIIGGAGIVAGCYALLLRVGLTAGGGAPARTTTDTPNDVNGVAHHGNLVQYVSPFGASAWLPDWQAAAFLEQDDKRWLRLEELEMVTTAQRAVGPPHIAFR